MLDLHLFWRRWWHPCRWDSIPDSIPPVQYHLDLSATTFQIHLEHICYPRRGRRWRGRGFPNSPLHDEHWIWKKSLTDIYVSMNIHYHMDYVHICVHIWNINFIIPQYLGFKWHLQIWRPDDYIPVMKTSLHSRTLDTKMDYG